MAPENIKTIDGFRSFDKTRLQTFREDYALAMSIEDIQFVQSYFTGEGREPTETEIRVLDTYWSDHCRHTTFLTELKDIRFDTQVPEIEAAYNEYRRLFKKHYTGRPDKYECLMDMATIGVRELKSKGLLPALDESEEINACSIKVRADTNESSRNSVKTNSTGISVNTLTFDLLIIIYSSPHLLTTITGI